MTIASQEKKSYMPLIFIFVLIKLAIHLYTNAFAGYGIFRDELYLYACSLRLDIGYVDQPPLSIWILRLTTLILGKSVFAMRLVAALFGAMAIIPLAMSVRMLGGKKIAISIASVAFIISPICLAYCGYYSMNSIDVFLWTSAIFILIRLHITQQPIYWIWLGLAIGLALLNKIGMLWFGSGLMVSLLITKERVWLSTKWPYLAGIIAFSIFSPYLLWNGLNGWPTLEFIGNASEKYGSQNQVTFLLGQVLINNPVNMIVWIPGIIYFIMNIKVPAARSLFIIFITVLLILLFNGNTKPEYLSQIFVVLYIGGALIIESWTERKKWIAIAVITVQVTGLVTLPMAIPILPVEKYIAFSNSIGMTPATPEGHELAELPQFYADMFGWENQAKSIAKVYHSLPPEDQQVCSIFGDNYGRSGAVDYFSEKYDLPLAIGRHNNYWIWGPDKYNGKLLIILSDELGDKATLFEEVTDLGTVYSPYAIPYENNLHIFLCKNLKTPVEELWPKIKSYN